MSNIILIGFMGSGKSSVGRLLAEKLERKFVDMDDEIEIAENKTINEIFEEYGEEHFRSLETGYLEKLLTKKNKVISTGGGVIIKEENVEILRKIGVVVYLNTSIEQLMKNLEGDTLRPLLQGKDVKEKIVNLLRTREPIYFEAANMIIQTEGKSVEDVTNEIIKLL